ncbi:N-glycosylase/DNA lyase [Methanomicrobium sp. W14]|uniref:DNA-3-methyladenine glycosylase family protein n=1 Tax=Methanomicrobium sp. W14 TaxID=2817839 RepID=UPI001AE7C3CC|nr:DNA glycosylase [Methanomicrobium sp. W14]MBP2134333.1 N-glycosylase/DNA lyase [Methanomicrobium sp. W14]
MIQTFSLEKTPFSLSTTLSCGQVFRWHETGGWWRGIAHGKLIKIRQKGNILEYSGCDEDFIRYYFHFDADLDEILASINRDENIDEAIKEHAGLRVVRQDPWECLLTYLCGQNTSIPLIEKMLDSMSEMSGVPVEDGEEKAYLYPTPQSLSGFCRDEIAKCSTGYRASYICSTASEIAGDKGWADRILSSDYESARKEIMKYKGIGMKVADCILLFGFQKYESFPVDRWVKKIMYGLYGVGDSEKTLSCGGYEKVRRFGQEHFGPYCGYAQEYLFAGR